MNRIDAAFARLRTEQAHGLIPFVCGGHPVRGATERALTTFGGAGASVIEVGIPFSDPIADGPVIAAAMHEVLTRPDPATPSSIFDEVRAARKTTEVALIAMVSMSIVHRCGPSAFVSDCARAGFDGLIVPDLPLEESDQVRGLARDAGLTCSLLVSPTTPPPRAAAIAAASTGFVYLLARTGITGDTTTAPAANLPTRVAEIRAATDLPIACGFGISTPEQVREVVRHTNAAIVGSVLVRCMGDAAKQGKDPVNEGAALVRTLVQAL